MRTHQSKFGCPGYSRTEFARVKLRGPAFGLLTLYSGHEERKEQGVGLLLSARAYNSLDGDWSAFSPRLLRARFRSRQARLTMIVAYASTLASDETIMHEFYESLDSLLCNCLLYTSPSPRDS